MPTFKKPPKQRREKNSPLPILVNQNLPLPQGGEGLLLDILVCPKTGQGLMSAEPSLVQLLNKCIAKKLVRTSKGKTLIKPVDGLLLRQDLLLAYAVRADLPIMIYDEAIEIQYISDRQWLSELKCVKVNSPK